MTDSPIQESIFKANPSRPTRASTVLTDLYMSFEQVSAPVPELKSKPRHLFYRSSFLSPSIWIALIILGLSTAFIAFTIDYLSQKLLEARYYMSSTESIIGNFIIWVLFSLFFGLLAASTGKFISSECEGSGIPEVKAILAGVHLTRYLSVTTLAAKIAGLIAASAAGLSIGKEGPFVHIASILANKINKTKYIRQLPNSITISHQILGAAVACGVAAAFGAPIGGVLFSIEVTSTYYIVNNLWKGVFCALWCMVGYTLFHMSEITDLIHLTKFEPIDFGWEIFAFAVLGILSGLLGACFVYVASKLIYLRSHMAYPKFHTRFRYTLLITLVCAVVNYSAAFLQLSDKTIINQMFRAEKLSNYDQLYWNNPSTMFNLTLYVVIKLGLTALSISCQVPCGFVAPVFTGGAAFGRLFGYLIDMILETEHKGVYAVVGAACLVSSVTHTLSIAVVVFELTGQMNYILPMLTGVLISYSVSATISMSMYNVILKIKGLPYLPSIKPLNMYRKSLHELCTSNLQLYQTTSIRSIVSVLSQCLALDKLPITDKENYLIGEVSIERLKKLIIETYSTSISRLKPEDKEFLNYFLNPLLMSEKSYFQQWSPNEETSSVSAFFDDPVILDLDIIETEPISVLDSMSLIKIQFIFIMLGLNQLYVINRGKLVGVISRANLTVSH